MLKSRVAKPMLVALAACAASIAFNGIVFADDAQTQVLKDQMRVMQEQLQEMQKKLDALSKQQATPPAAAPTGPPPTGAGPSVAKAKEAPTEPLFDKFIKGFYGSLDVSVDDSTKGMDGMVAYHYGGTPVNGVLSARRHEGCSGQRAVWKRRLPAFDCLQCVYPGLARQPRHPRFRRYEVHRPDRSAGRPDGFAGRDYRLHGADGRREGRDRFGHDLCRAQRQGLGLAQDRSWLDTVRQFNQATGSLRRHGRLHERSS